MEGTALRPIWFALLFAVMASAAHAQKWTNFAYVSATSTLVTNTLCYIDGRDLACDSSAGLLVTSGTVAFTNISATNISASTAIQVGSNNLACTTSVSGTMRYSAVSSTMEFCNGSNWLTMNASTTVPAFSVSRGGTNQTVTTNTTTAMDWTTKSFDTTGAFNLSTDRFTPLVPGKYLFTLSIYCSDSTIYCYAEIYKNGTGASYSYFRGTQGATETTTVLLDMNGTTDYVSAYVYNGGGTTIYGDPTYTHFDGTLIASGNGLAGSGGATPAGSSGDVQYNSGSALAADTGNFTYSSSVLKAPTVSSTYDYSSYVSSTTGTFGSIGSGLINATGISITTNQTSVTTLYASGKIGIGTSSPSQKLDVAGNVNVTGNVMAGYERVTATSANYATSPVTANCSAGKYVLGGGCSGSCGYYNGTIGDYIYSAPSGYPASTTSFGCYCANSGSSYPTTTAYAICARIQ